MKTANTEEYPAGTNRPGINWYQIGIGLVVLSLGTLVYVFDRSPAQTYFIYQSSFTLGLNNSISGLFGHIGSFLPSFIHAFAFVLITAGLITASKKSYLFICLFWFLIDVLFEFGQRFITSIGLLNSWFSGIPFLENTEKYFINGTFDWNDVAATIVGVTFAYLVLRVTSKIGRGIS